MDCSWLFVWFHNQQVLCQQIFLVFFLRTYRSLSIFPLDVVEAQTQPKYRYCVNFPKISLKTTKLFHYKFSVDIIKTNKNFATGVNDYEQAAYTCPHTRHTNWQLSLLISHRRFRSVASDEWKQRTTDNETATSNGEMEHQIPSQLRRYQNQFVWT